MAFGADLIVGAVIAAMTVFAITLFTVSWLAGPDFAPQKSTKDD